MAMKKNPAPFSDFRRLPDTLTRSGEIVRTPLSTHYVDAAIREYRSVGGQPPEDTLIVEAQTDFVRETAPERVNNSGVVALRFTRR